MTALLITLGAVVLAAVVGFVIWVVAELVAHAVKAGIFAWRVCRVWREAGKSKCVWKALRVYGYCLLNPIQSAVIRPHAAVGPMSWGVPIYWPGCEPEGEQND